MTIYKRLKNGKFEYQRSGVFTARNPSIVNVVDGDGVVLDTDTEQHHANDVDINNIVGTFIKTGMLPQVQSELRFTDVSKGLSYQDCLDVLNDANERFNALSATIRKRFHNSVSEFIEFVEDDNNIDEAIKLGIVAKKASAGIDSSTLGSGGTGTDGEVPANAGGGG